MVVEAVQNYVNMVNGLTRTTREKAVSTARAVLAQAGLEDAAIDAGERVSKLAEEILLASRANRELMENLITAEVDRAAARLGFVRTDEVDALRNEIAELRLSLVRVTVQASEATTRPPARKSPAGPPPAKNVPADSIAPDAPAKKSAAKKTASTKSAATKSAATKSAATTTAASKTAAKKTAAKKTAAKKTAAGKRSPAKKSALTPPAANPPVPPVADGDQ